MILFLHGQDDYRIDKRMRSYRDAFAKKYNVPASQVETVFGDEVNVSSVDKRMRSAGLFTKKELFVLKGFLRWASAADKKTLGRLVAAWDKAENVLIWIEQVPDDWKAQKALTGTVVWKKLTALSHTEDYPALTGVPLTRWIHTEAQKLRGDAGAQAQEGITQAAVQLLARNIGSDLWRASSALEQLTALCADRAINEDDVRAMVSARVNEDVFGLIDAVAARRFDDALRKINEQLQFGISPIELLVRLQKHVEHLVIAVHGSQNSATLAKALGVHPFVAKKLVSQARRFSPQEVEALFNRLLDVEVDLKSTGFTPELLFARAFTRGV